MESNPSSVHLYRSFACARCDHLFTAPVSCGDRFCSVCSFSRLRRVRAKLEFLSGCVHESNGYRFKFVTLTQPNQESLEIASKRLVSAFRRLRQRCWWSTKCVGGAYVIEVTGSPGKWHCHLHILCLSRYLSFKKLSKHWKAVGGGTIVHVKNVPKRAAVIYMTKYLTKPSVQKGSEAICGKLLKGVRLFQPFGNWQRLVQEMPKNHYVCPFCGSSAWYYVHDGDLFHLLQNNGRDPCVDRWDRHRKAAANYRADVKARKF